MSLPPGPTAHIPGAALVAPIAAITVFGMSLSMSFPLFGLLLERGGVSGALIGINTTAGAVATAIGAPLMPQMLRRTGLGPMMIGAALLLAAAMLAVPLLDGFWVWTALRFCFGAAASGLFFASEFWIVAAAPALTRGRIIAIYAFCVSGGYAVGPVILGIVGLDGIRPFAIAAAMVLAGTVPILWGLRWAPSTEDGEAPPSPFAVLRVFVTDPSAVFAVVLFAVIEFGAMGLMAVWGVRSGLPEAEAALLLTACAVGAMAMQMPLGWAADRLDRRLVLALCAAGSAVAALLLAAAGGRYGVMLSGAVLLGGLSVGLYSVALTEMGARYRGSRLAAANAAIVLGYGLGALFAPSLLGWAMDRIPPDGMVLATTLLALAYLALVAARIARARRRSSGSGGETP